MHFLGVVRYLKSGHFHYLFSVWHYKAYLRIKRGSRLCSIPNKRPFRSWSLCIWWRSQIWYIVYFQIPVKTMLLPNAKAVGAVWEERFSGGQGMWVRTQSFSSHRTEGQRLSFGRSCFCFSQMRHRKHCMCPSVCSNGPYWWWRDLESEVQSQMWTAGRDVCWSCTSKDTCWWSKSIPCLFIYLEIHLD